MDLISFSLMCFGFCSAFVGLIVFFRRTDPVGASYFFFSITGALWGIFIGMFLNRANSYETAITYLRVADSIATLIPATWFHFVSYLTDNAPKNKRWVVFLYIVSGFLFLASQTPWFMDFKAPTDSTDFEVVPKFFFHVFVAVFFIIVPTGFVMILQKAFKTQLTQEKKQMWGALISLAAAFIGGSLTFLPVYNHTIPTYVVCLMPIYPFIIAYFMMRHGLFNPEDFANAAHKSKLVSLGILTASINHEIRNPVYIIRGLAETRLDQLEQDHSESSEKNKTSFEKIITQSNRIIAMSRTLSRFSKKGSDEPATLESLNLQEVMNDLYPLFKNHLFDQKIKFVSQIPDPSPSVLADRRFFEEILFNLIVNAHQALREKKGEGEISLIASPLETENKVKIEVRDNGPGIAKHRLKTIFKPFHTTKKEGTGLGLYITQQLVEKCKGRMSVDSTLGEHTTFTIVFET